MKLPRWLSPVRTVEAETGWPRSLSRQFASHIEDRFFWRDLLVGSVVAAAIAWPWSEAARWLLRLAFGADGPPWPPQVTAIVALLVVPGLALVPLILFFSHRRRLSK